MRTGYDLTLEEDGLLGNGGVGFGGVIRIVKTDANEFSRTRDARPQPLDVCGDWQ
jgi:hypothetical protein